MQAADGEILLKKARSKVGSFYFTFPPPFWKAETSPLEEIAST